MFGKGSVYIKGKLAGEKRFKRLGSSGLVSNVMHCVFWPPADKWKAEKVLKMLQEEYPEGIFKMEETR
jgi:hypothetical protein|tara:strand:- start:875 stop:1078 length:204 start_codon:yes stop_codon:yes gene_type:complete